MCGRGMRQFSKWLKIPKHNLVACRHRDIHYNDVIMSTMASQITSLTIVYSTCYSGTDQRRHQSSAPLAFVRRIHRWPVNSPLKGPVTRKMFPFDDVIVLKARRFVLQSRRVSSHNNIPYSAVIIFWINKICPYRSLLRDLLGVQELEEKLPCYNDTEFYTPSTGVHLGLWCPRA